MRAFVYLWRDHKRRMFYVGSHIGAEADGYICSNTRMMQAYRKRPQDFKRRIIEKIDIVGEIRLAEARWLQMIKPDELGKRYYNLKRVATGFDSALARNIALKQHSKKDKQGRSLLYLKMIQNVDLAEAGRRLGRQSHIIKDIDGKSIHAKRIGSLGAAVTHAVKGPDGKSLYAQRSALLHGAERARKSHSEKLSDGRSARMVRINKQNHAEKTEDGKSIFAIKMGLASAAVESWRIATTTLHAKRDERGRSLHALKMNQKLHAEKDAEGKSIHARKIHAEKNAEGKSLQAVKNAMKRWHPEIEV